jgi:glycosyltransferase involved in cell wall biosynthesis
LLISYLFPPCGGIAVQRALSIAKYLPSRDVEVTVLTASNAAAPVRDEGLVRHIPPEVEVERTLTLEPPFYLRKKIWSALERIQGGGKKEAGTENASPGGGGLSRLVKRVLMPDPQVLWKPAALRAAYRIIRERRIDTVMVTAPPFSVFLIGNAIKRRFPEVRLVSDFRDEWLRFYLTDFDFLSDEATRAKAVEIERSTIESSDLVLAVTRSSLDEIRGRYREQAERKFALLPNGFDPAAVKRASGRWPGAEGKMVVTHVGTAYRTASPRYYLDAVDRLPEEIRANVITRFIGRVAETETKVFEGRGSQVEVTGFLPQAEALRKTEETDYLLLTMTNDFSLPGKLFEYLATGRPVLAFSPPGGEVDRLLAETRGGWCAPHDDANAMERLLMEAWETREARRASFAPDWEAIARYERPRLAGELAELLRSRLDRRG